MYTSVFLHSKEVAGDRVTIEMWQGAYLYKIYSACLSICTLDFLSFVGNHTATEFGCSAQGCDVLIGL